MAESYFNEEQQGHMRYLASIPRRQRCASGWHLTGECGEPVCTPMRWTVCHDCGKEGHFLCIDDRSWELTQDLTTVPF